jgi:hypothetical protein
MTITINGVSIDPPEGQATLGDTLSLVDAELERVGLAISGISVDGEDKDAEGLRLLRDEPVSSVGALAIEAVRASELRLQAFDLVLSRLAECLASLETDDGFAQARTALGHAIQAISGVLSADENSMLTLPDSRGPFEAPARACERLLMERVSEIKDPAGELVKASRAFAASSGRIATIAVDMQTGKDKEAVATLLVFVELFNKLLRLIPELRAAGIAVDSIMVGEKPLADFFEGLNAALKELTDGFERRDTVAIGDMAEYEVVPKLTELFNALEGALGAAATGKTVESQA